MSLNLLVRFLPFLVFLTYTMANPTRRATCSKGRTASNPQCCVWYDVLDDIQRNLFSGSQCDEVAHDTLRLTFHDAIGWSPALAATGVFGGGGADGSILEFSWIELSYPGNVGLEVTVEDMSLVAYNHNVSYGDIIQFAGAVGVRNCAGGPRLEFLAGRPKAVQASPPGLLPDAASDVTTILARFADAGFSADELVDLLTAHSIGFQEHVDPTVAFTPFDSTPEAFDSQFFVETLLQGTLIPGDTLHSGEVMSPIPGEFRLQSDYAIARDSRTACRWQSFIHNENLMSESFKKVMAKLAVLGQDTSQLVDCSEVIPPPDLPLPPAAHLPPGKNISDLELSCPAMTMPALKKASGPVVPIPPAFSEEEP